ncbi:MAG: methyltransferase domain-containing protein [Pseudomonadota bacterium]|nr:methyltransferase domain-containing protein [Pseudomonadota bacterium]
MPSAAAPLPLSNPQDRGRRRGLAASAVVGATLAAAILGSPARGERSAVPGTTAGATQIEPLAAPGLPAGLFPRPDRPVAGIVSNQWSTEDTRERAGEAKAVMDLLGVRPGMRVADVGAGAGYYTINLARRVGPTGRVIAEDVVPSYLEGLRRRVERERLGNVVVALGAPHDPRLPPRSVDLALMVHMYHEIQQPFGLLANLWPAVRPGARVAILDANRPTPQHGTPPPLLTCELAAVGYRQIGWHWLEGRATYLAVFEPPPRPPKPASIVPCRAP